MNVVFKKGALWLLLMLGTASAFAWPDRTYPVQYQPYAQQRDFQDRRGQDRQGGERRRRGDGDYQRRDAGGQDGGRRARMTPDERRTLRRQINEAGRDLYPRR